jgi:hypothetical protein
LRFWPKNSSGKKRHPKKLAVMMVVGAIKTINHLAPSYFPFAKNKCLKFFYIFE